MVSGIKTGTGMYLIKSRYGVNNFFQKLDSDINSAIGRAKTMEIRKAIITRDSVAKISTARLLDASDMADAITFTGEGKNNGLMRLVCSVMKYHKPNKNNTDIRAGQKVRAVFVGLATTSIKSLDNTVGKFVRSFQADIGIAILLENTANKIVGFIDIDLATLVE